MPVGKNVFVGSPLSQDPVGTRSLTDLIAEKAAFDRETRAATANDDMPKTAVPGQFREPPSRLSEPPPYVPFLSVDFQMTYIDDVFVLKMGCTTRVGHRIADVVDIVGAEVARQAMRMIREKKNVEGSDGQEKAQGQSTPLGPDKAHAGRAG